MTELTIKNTQRVIIGTSAENASSCQKQKGPDITQQKGTMRVGCTQCKLILLGEYTIHDHMRKHQKSITQTQKGGAKPHKEKESRE